MKPNIVEIIWHDLGQHLGCYGWENIKSPSLDQLAEEGTLLENMFCTAPQCSPSRASIMTGCYPHSNGMMGLAHLGWGYNKGQRTITHILAENGYTTYLSGDQHETGVSLEEYKKERLGYDHVINEELSSFIENKLDKTTPFFLSVGFADTHRPYNKTVTKDDMNNTILPSYVPDNEGTRKDMVKYEKTIEETDKKVGKILASLRNAGLEDNTIVFFTTDHGPEFNRAKMTLYDPGIKVACIFKWQGHIKNGARLKGLHSNIDILPTLLDLAGITIPEFIQGESFKWSLLGYEDKSREYIIAEKTFHLIYDPMRCIRTSRYKYIVNMKPHVPMQISVAHSVMMGLELASELYGQKRMEEELYDLVNDPDEKYNLAYKQEYSDIRNLLRNKLYIVLGETNDPLLKGDIPNKINIAPQIEWIFNTNKGRFELKVTDACPDHLLSEL